MKTMNKGRVWVEINTDSIRKNIQTIKQKVEGRDVMAVLKANAYGLGVKEISKILESEGVSRFGVANLDEALEIREESELPIQILGGVLEEEIKLAIQKDIILPIGSIDIAKRMSQIAKNLEKDAKCHILVDTGMGRLGLVYDEEKVIEEIKEILKIPNIYIEGIYTHYSIANVPTNSHTKNQLKRFKKVLKKIPKTFDIIHTANSDAINNFPNTYFDMVRTGINLYGVFDLEGRRAYSLEPAISLKSRVIDIRKLKKDSPIGYGCEYTLKEDSLVATVCAGYADGIPLAYGNKGEVLINGKRFPVIGRVSMDYIAVDLGMDFEIEKEDDVIFIGKSGRYEITVEDMARIKKTHPYEIICSITPRVKRLYI
jgi:alanine racemase